MQHFVNEYEYTPDLIEENLGAWWDCKFKAGYRSMLSVFIVIVVLSIVMKRPVFLLAELAPFFIIVLFKLKKKKAIQLEQERIGVLFHASSVPYRIEIGEDISATSPRGNNHFQFSDVEKYIETRNLIILFIKGSMTLPFAKEGFKEGTKEAFLSLLADTIK